MAEPQVEPLDIQRQETTRITLAENQFTNNTNSIDVFRTPLPCSSNSYEIVGLKPSAGNLLLGVKDFLSPAAKLVDMPQVNDDAVKTSVPVKRLLSRTIFQVQKRQSRAAAKFWSFRSHGHFRCCLHSCLHKQAFG